MIKLIKRICLFLSLIIILVFLFLFINGFIMYKDVINEKSIDDKIKEIRENENFISIDNVSNYFLDAIVSVEDHRFYKHKGIDALSTLKAMFTNAQSKTIVTGGSSITQQLARNMYFTQEHKFTRKVAELFVASEIETKLSKKDILELYINTIYYGSGYYGIRSASAGYFSKEPDKLNLDESTMLAGIPNAPSIYSLDVSPELAKQRQKQVINSMVQYKYLTKKEASEILEK